MHDAAAAAIGEARNIATGCAASHCSTAQKPWRLQASGTGLEMGVPGPAGIRARQSPAGPVTHASGAKGRGARLLP